MKSVFVKKILKWLLLILSIVVIAFAVATYFLLTNKDRITQIVQKQLNSHLVQPVHVEKVNISLIKKIPYITVEFHNVWASPVIHGYSDTLFSVENIYVMLNVFKAIKGNYNINRLVFRDGFVNIYIGPDGKSNYIIWKGSQSEEKKQYSIELKDISFENINLNYFSYPNKLKMASYIGLMKLSGELKQGGANLQLRSNMFITYIYRGNTKYVRNGKTSLKVYFIKEGDFYKITNGSVRVNKQNVDANGFINYKTGDTRIALSTQNIRFDSDDNIFNLDEKITSFARIRGEVNSVALLSGNYRLKNRLNINVNFNLIKGEVKFNDQALYYSVPYLKGSYNTSKRNGVDVFKIDSLALTGNDDNITGSFEILNFEKPVLNVSAGGRINTQNLNSFVKNKEVVFGHGKIDFRYHVKDVLLNEDVIWKQFFDKAYQSSFTPVIDKLYIGFLDKEFYDIKAEFYYNKSLAFKKLSISAPGSDFSVDGTISDLYKLIDNQNTWISLRTYSENINLDALLAKKEPKNEGAKYPGNIFLRCESFTEKLVINKISYNDVSSELFYKPGLATLKVYNSKVFDGTLKGNCALAFTEDSKMKLAVLAEIEKVDITKMFNAYNNFGQTFIVANNLKGALSANVDVKYELTPGFHIIAPSIMANANINITDGELLNHEPMYKLSRYIKLEELKHIYFSNLSNEVFINDQCVTIPQMQIKSSAMDIEVSGRHYFDNHFEYLLTVYLSDFLARKISSPKQKEDEFIYVQHSDAKHFMLPYLIAGDTANYEVRLNKKKVAGNFAGSIQKEKNAVKTALKNEFKIFNKDTAEVKMPGDPGLIFNFEEKQPDVKSADEKPKEGENTILKFEWDDD